ncbi:hypothetical protein [Paraburkholderia sp. HD33-4]|uniref:hypothetical protein n=1 Tax=Paraburkholderia sp. HD33-4 TaxID=2883242 RepID=UPI001F3E06C2|nr:hypothetical protein [Paraburkholderia sp. HD33-4]
MGCYLAQAYLAVAYGECVGKPSIKLPARQRAQAGKTTRKTADEIAAKIAAKKSSPKPVDFPRPHPSSL